MPITRRVLLATAIASLAPPAISSAEQPRTGSEIKCSVRIYKLRTHRSDEDLIRGMSLLSGKEVRAHAGRQVVLSGLVDGGSPLDLSEEDALLSRLGQVQPVITAQMTSIDGKQSPLSVGQDVPYLKGINDGKESFDVIRTGLSLHLEPNIRDDGAIDLRVAHQIIEIEGMDKVSAGTGPLRELPRVHKEVAIFTANVRKGQSVVCMSRSKSDDKHLPDGRSFVVTIITPKVIA